MARRKLENVPDSGLDDYVDYHWDDVEAEAAKAGVGAEDLLFDDLVRRNRLDRFGPEVLELISDGLYGEEEVDRAFWMGGHSRRHREGPPGRMTHTGRQKSQAPVAQWIGRRPPKAETAGPNPAGGTGSGRAVLTSLSFRAAGSFL